MIINHIPRREKRSSTNEFKDGIKLFVNQSDIEIQAQNAILAIAAKQDIKIDSVEGKTALSSAKEIPLPPNGGRILYQHH
ncbi:DUF2345 domain-containing protein [Candidatus Schmidhempelia bombi]|uniref:DUF2345 domain-containing protein n=1 Tax=Candidatus Schmidhempelia bombi str. Bimp TaxID=1387197 RepID=A0AB94IAN8_9GAMM|nr:DUF2345 domain-containing protein [Candidatus Schmidhempelia bombi str. Bimp]